MPSAAMVGIGKGQTPSFVWTLEFNRMEFENRQHFLTIAASFEGGMAFLALALGWFADVDPLAAFAPFCWMDMMWGCAAALAMFVALLVVERFPLAGFRRIKQLLVEFLGRPLAMCRWYDLILLAALVGFSEELLFRGLVQPWMERSFDRPLALFWSNVLFGLLHCVTALYGVLAGLTGALLGWLLDATGRRSLLVPMTTHAVYDYIAFLWIIRTYRREQGIVRLNASYDDIPF